MTEERHLGGVHEVPSSENIAITSKAALSSGYVEPPTSPECDESRACAADLRAQYETTAEAPFSGASRGAMAAMHKSKKQLAEDEEYTSDHDLTQLGDKSPFNNIRHLLRYPAHLAVFLRYLLDNQSDFSSLLFLIITDLYKRGSRKEMKKWVYEITSTFLLQSAPLRIDNIDDTIVKEIGKVVKSRHEQERQEKEALKDVFFWAGEEAMEQLKRPLFDFRRSHTIGLSSLHMNIDETLDDALWDKDVQLRIVESTLVEKLETLVPADPVDLKDYKVALASALATVIKSFGVKTPSAQDRVMGFPTFVARESRVRRVANVVRETFSRNPKSQPIFTLGHKLQPQHYNWITDCNFCRETFWGVGPQGYRCFNCGINVHTSCLKMLGECIGSPMRQRNRAGMKHRWSSLRLMGGIKKKASSQPHGGSRRGSSIEPHHHSDEWCSLPTLPPLVPLAPFSTVPCRVKVGEKRRLALRTPEITEAPVRINARKGLSTALDRTDSYHHRRVTPQSYNNRSLPNLPKYKSGVDMDDQPTNLNDSHSSVSSISSRSADEATSKEGETSCECREDAGRPVKEEQEEGATAAPSAVPTLEMGFGAGGQAERHTTDYSGGTHLVVAAPVAAPSMAQGSLSLVDFQEVGGVPSGHCGTATPELTPIHHLGRLDGKVLSAVAEKEALKTDTLRTPSKDCAHLAEDDDGNTSRHVAVAKQKPEITVCTTDLPKDDFFLSNTSPTGALQTADITRPTIVVKMKFSQSGALVNPEQEDRECFALHSAAAGGHNDVVELLLNQETCIVNLENKDGDTALVLAARKGHWSIVESLVLAGADINKADRDGNTALHFSLKEARKQSTRLQDMPTSRLMESVIRTILLVEGPDISDTVQVACFLVQSGAEIRQRNKDGTTPLDLAFLIGDAAAELLGFFAVWRRDADSGKCRRCLEVSTNICFEPCGHCLYCDDCAQRMKRCLSCNAYIHRRVSKCPSPPLTLEIDKTEVAQAQELKVGPEDMLLVFVRAAKAQKQDRADCFALILLSNGANDTICCSDGRKLSLSEDVCPLFDDTNSPSLKGKPKLFFIQYCPGAELDNESDGGSTTDDKAPAASGDLSAAQAILPRDMCIAYTTIPPFAAVKKQRIEFPFLSAVWEVFSKHAYNKSLGALMRLVHKMVMERCPHDGSEQTLMVVQYSFTRELYFNPGLHEC
ncbi:uncharacterized protein LOC144147096 isoform X2 [Haemaphysalis longicornis]